MSAVDPHTRCIELRNTIFEVMNGKEGKYIRHNDLFIDSDEIYEHTLIGVHRPNIIEMIPSGNDRWRIYYEIRPYPALRGIDNWEAIARLINFLECGMIERGVIPTD